MAITFSCNHCGKSLSTSDDKAGRKAKCPGCGEVLTVPESVDAASDNAFDDEGDHDADAEAGDFPDAPPPLRKKSSSAATGTKTCPMCGAENPRKARKCDACGEEFETADEPRRRRREFEYAGFWLRFAAHFIDSILLGCVNFAVGAGVGIVLAVIIIGANNGNPNALDEGGAGILIQLVAQAIGLLVGWMYYALMESSAKQATLGKMAVGIQVCDMDGRRITFGRATGRFFGKMLSGLICLIGYIMAGFTEQKQALHDQLAGTLVVRN